MSHRLKFPVSHWLGCGYVSLAELWLCLIGCTVTVSHRLKFPLSHWLGCGCFPLAELLLLGQAGLFFIGCAVTRSHWWLLLDKKEKIIVFLLDCKVTILLPSNVR